MPRFPELKQQENPINGNLPPEPGLFSRIEFTAQFTGIEVDSPKSDNAAKNKQDVVTYTDHPTADGGFSRNFTNQAKMAFTSQGYVRLVQNPDGNSLTCEYPDNCLMKIQEKTKSGNKLWVCDGTVNRWRSMDAIGTQRLNWTVGIDGTSTYGDTAGTEHKTYLDGSRLLTNADGSRAELDQNNHLVLLHTAKGVDFHCKFQDKPSAIEETERNKTTVWTEKEKGIWSNGSGQTRTDFKLLLNGQYSYVEHKDGDVTRVQYADGGTRNFSYKDHALDQIDENTDGNPRTWRRIPNTDNFTWGGIVHSNVLVSADGTYSFTSFDGFKHACSPDNKEELQLSKTVQWSSEVDKSREYLLDVARQKMTSTDFACFQRDQIDFQKNASAFGIKDTDVAGTYQEVTALLASPELIPQLKPGDQVVQAQELLHALAEKRDDNQGFHQTCNVTTERVVMTATDPKLFASYVRQLVTTGQWVTSKQHLIKLDAESLQPDWEAQQHKPYGTANGSKRSYIGQLFDVAAVQSYYSVYDPKFRYEQKKPLNPDDTGEWLIENSTGKKVASAPGLSNDQLMQVSEELFGRRIPFLAHTRDGGKLTSNFDSETTFQQQVEKLQSEKKLPAIVCVYTGYEPLWTASAGLRSGKPPGWHVVTLWNSEAGLALVDNQWGQSHDYEGSRRLKLSSLFNMTVPP